MSSPPTDSRLPKANRKLVRSALVALFVVCAVVLAARYLSGTTIQETQKRTAEEKAKEALRASAPTTPAAIAAKADAQIGQEKRRQAEDAKKAAETAKTLPAVPPGTTAGTEPLRMPPGSPAVAGAGAAVAPGDAPAGYSAADASRNVRNQGRASSMVAFEDTSALAGSESVQPSSPGGPMPMDKLAEQLRAASAPMPTGLPGGDSGMAGILKMAQTAQSAPASVGRPAMSSASPASGGGGSSNLTQKSDAWLGQQDAAAQNDPAPLTPKASPSEFVLFEGTSIPIVLTRDVNSDLPGQISAMVTQHIYDSVDNRYLLIPAGSRLVGSYNSDVVPGQSRLLMAFSRMFFPNGASVRLGAMQANDVNGAAGADAEVSTHFFKMFSTSLIIGAVALAAAPGASNTNLTINMSGGGSGAGAAAGQILADTVKRVLDRNQNIKPTLSLGKGERLTLTTARDMILPPTVTGGRQVY